MLDEHLRITILKLYDAGHGKRAIARALKLSRAAVRKVIASCSKEVPTLERAEKAEPYHNEILEQVVSCKGNLVRVHEEILALGAKVSYPALTGYCRRHGIGHEPQPPAGQYVFEPGKEMQHDTSPHPAHIGGRERKVQIAGLALHYSRLSFIQLYPRFTRFECKLFLDDAIDYVGGVCENCMIDNTGVIVLRGTGADMVPVPEMAAFAEQRGFEFRAHEKGDANRSAVVEGLFNTVQRNFLAGRKFLDFDDANRQAIEWCDKLNAAFSRKLHASRRELFAKEQPRLKPLPIWRSPIYRLLHRIVDLESYVHVHGFCYEVPSRLIGRRLEVRETKSATGGDSPATLRGVAPGAAAQGAARAAQAAAAGADRGRGAAAAGRASPSVGLPRRAAQAGCARPLRVMPAPAVANAARLSAGASAKGARRCGALRPVRPRPGRENGLEEHPGRLLSTSRFR